MTAFFDSILWPLRKAFLVLWITLWWRVDSTLNTWTQQLTDVAFEGQSLHGGMNNKGNLSGHNAVYHNGVGKVKKSNPPL